MNIFDDVYNVKVVLVRNKMIYLEEINEKNEYK